ncbi:MAG: hypothetical protein M1834_008226 [Cirrosporium novae-zelandiae]|nr:MAG: hypothetical protein M1834_008226 [Cirrosporium novae-zelandiae]
MGYTSEHDIVVDDCLKLSPSVIHGAYIVHLSGPLRTPENVRVAAGLHESPKRISGRIGESRYCYVNGLEKQAISKWLALQGSFFTPKFIRLPQKAEKNLSAISMFPTLGVDSTLPQHRAADEGTIFEPAQEQYPVWYFFYGTLTNDVFLSRIIQLPKDEALVLVRAFVSGGKLGIWNGRYKGLVDAPSNALVHGYAYKVTSKEQEDYLRIYETDHYEVVRCTIFMHGRGVQGCTFRFVGSIA